MRFVFWTFIVLLLAAPVTLRAEEPRTIELARKGPWVADYDVNRCRMIGRFGEGDNELTAIFTRYGPGDWIYVTIVGDKLALRANKSLPDVKYAFGPGQDLTSKSVFAGTVDGKPALISNASRLDGSTIILRDPKEIPPRISEAQETAITQFDLLFGQSRSFRLELGSMGKPMAQMRKCIDLLMASWGYDPKQYATLQQPALPRNHPGNWLTYTDYPHSALTKGHQGTVKFRLDVDETGKVSNCHILEQTQPADFGDLSCRLLMKRAQFDPALDSAGQAVKSFFVSSATFAM